MSTATKEKAWPNYRTVWRWHFYAGLFCIPLITVLSITGAIYLFKPQIEHWLDQPYAHLVTTKPVSAQAQVEAALTAVPNSTLSAYELPQNTTSAVQILVMRNNEAIRIYVHPQTLQILNIISEVDRPMNIVMRLHGELLFGNTGSAIVELAASWAIIMIITGLYLWWPQAPLRFAGIIYPRLRAGSRLFWRDIHGVTGFWISAFALFLLITGLPWANVWGSYFQKIRHLTHTEVAQQDWPTGHASSHHHGTNHLSDISKNNENRFAPLEKIIATIQPLQLAPPVLISPPPTVDSTIWSAKSDTQNRPLRADILLDGESGEILQLKKFSERHVLDRIVGYGIAAHEGQLFGWVNQLLGLLTALGLITLCISAIVLWWRRRATGLLGAPTPIPGKNFKASFYLIVVMLAVYLPLFALSISAVLIIERFVLQRIPIAANWLGLART